MLLAGNSRLLGEHFHMYILFCFLVIGCFNLHVCFHLCCVFLVFDIVFFLLSPLGLPVPVAFILYCNSLLPGTQATWWLLIGLRQASRVRQWELSFQGGVCFVACLQLFV